MNTLSMHGETWTVTDGENGQAFTMHAHPFAVMIFWSSGTDYAYVIFNEETQEVEELFSNKPYVSLGSAQLPSVMLSALEALGALEDDYSEDDGYVDGWEDDDRDDTYESDGYAMIGGDSDLMNEW